MNQSKTALIVDDEDQLLRLMVRLLDRAGYRTLSAGDGAEALRLFKEHASEIDLAVIDVFHPPGAGASELLPKLLAEKPGLDVILTSGDALDPILEEMLASAGGRFLRKPFLPKGLLGMLEADDGLESNADSVTGKTESGIV